MNYKKLIIFLVLLISLFSVGYKANASVPVTGWLWSSAIGWVSLNCSNTNSCGTISYGVNVSTSTTDETDGTFSGFAWSPNVGWIKFEGKPSNIPSRPHPTIEIDGNGSINGFIRACAGTVNGDCTGADSPGWDGWIKLSGDNHGTGYPGEYTGVRYDMGADKITGFAWDPVNIGWLNFYDVNFDVDSTASTKPKLSFRVASGDGFGGYGKTRTMSSGANAPIIWSMSNIKNASPAYNCTLSGDTAVITNSSGAISRVAAEDGATESDGYAVTFTNTSTTEDITKTLEISCTGGLSSIKPESISVTVLRSNVGSCVQPVNSLRCNNNFSITQPLHLYDSSSECVSPTPSYCEYYCPTGYFKYENTCTKEGDVTET